MKHTAQDIGVNRNVQTPILATDDTCQFWQFWSLQNLPILATDNVCQFWQLWSLQNSGFKVVWMSVSQLPEKLVGGGGGGGGVMICA